MTDDLLGTGRLEPANCRPANPAQFAAALANDWEPYGRYDTTHSYLTVSLTLDQRGYQTIMLPEVDGKLLLLRRLDLGEPAEAA